MENCKKSVEFNIRFVQAKPILINLIFRDFFSTSSFSFCVDLFWIYLSGSMCDMVDGQHEICNN